MFNLLFYNNVRKEVVNEYIRLKIYYIYVITKMLQMYLMWQNVGICSIQLCVVNIFIKSILKLYLSVIGPEDICNSAIFLHISYWLRIQPL